jgi:hypothetical protein
VMMPLLFRAANAKADVSVNGWFGSIFELSARVHWRRAEGEDVPESKKGCDIIEMDGQQVGIRT